MKLKLGKVRPLFWFLLFLVIGIFPCVNAYAQTAFTTTAFTTGTSTQILASGGANPANSYSINFAVFSAATTTGVTMALVTGGQNGNTCTTPTNLIPSMPITAGTVGPLVLAGNPVMVVPGSSALCILVTGGTVSGMVTANR
jgi:hypothetical protein